MNPSPPARTLAVTAAIAAAITLAGCNTDGTLLSLRDLQPLSPQMVAEIEQKNMSKESPILVRLFKQEAELEVWKQDRTGRFALLKTYPICRWSGQLGPKIRQGDRQAPEGFYSITPARLNPNSSYYLAFNMGFPNAYDRAWGHTGANLMVHGDCSSRGCYAMTDQQMGEIYALARESFFGGQRSFQVQAYPFRMTPINMAKHRNNPNMRFWKMLKRGYDHFEVTHLEPKVDVCEKRYVFNAEPPAGSNRPLKFSATGHCPAYQVQQDIAQAVHDKQRRDEYRTAQLIARGTRTVPIRTAVDGGMHKVFLAGLKDKGKMRNGGPNYPVLAATPSLDAPPVVTAAASSEPAPVSATGSIAAADVPMPRAAPQPKTGAASGEKRSITSRIGSLFGFASDDTESADKPDSTRVASSSPGLFGNLFSSDDKAEKRKSKESKGVLDRVSRAIGLRGTEKRQAPTPRRKARPTHTARATSAAAIKPPPRPEPRPPVAASAAPPDAKAPPAGSAKPAVNAGAIPTQPKPKPLDEAPTQSAQTASNNARTSSSLVTGAAPVVPTGSFNNRWYGN